MVKNFAAATAEGAVMCSVGLYSHASAKRMSAAAIKPKVLTTFTIGAVFAVPPASVAAAT